MGWHVTRLVGGRILAALLVLVGVLQILDLLDVTTEILERNLGVAGMTRYAVLRLPRLVEQTAPLSVLAGALFAFAKLARDSEVVAMRSVGISAYRLTLMAVPAVALIMILQLAVSSTIAPRADEMLNDWWRSTTPVAEAELPGPRTFRLGDQIVTATPGGPGGRRLEDLSIYQRDQEGRLIEVIRADAATYADGEWRLSEARFRSITPEGVQTGTASEITWTPRLEPADVEAIFSDQPATPDAISAALQGGPAVRAPAYYETRLHRTWAAPAVSLVMLLLAAPTALGNFRSGQGATLLVACLGGGLLFLVLDGLFTAVGEGGLAPPVLAAWAAPAAFAALGATALLHLEG